ncbi:MAG TPA: glycosyltransferase family 2 protein [Steroidobacteraceae bacterium]|nr:glycosyltransferase family 2 protein [Steroidobacteraceae bacterium]HRX90564.1 glycosyltransferase family 2 protein [Steroidobacteraceae bacterium]
MIWVFGVSLAALIYIYAGYPIAIWLEARRKPVDHPESHVLCPLPDIAIVLPVYNDAARLARKLRNLKQLDYPANIRIVVVSDGSTDGTTDVALSTRGVETVVLTTRRGKPAALNAGMHRVHEEIVVFMDVRQQVDVLALRALARHFADPTIGAVSGLLVHLRPNSAEAASIGLYWRYERWIRLSESRFLSSVGATGALYAIRRKLWQDLPVDTLIDDFVTPMRVVRQGYRVMLDPTAVIYDELQTRVAGEFTRKVRTLMGNYQAMLHEPWLFAAENPLRFQWLSHKVARLLAPYFLLALLVSSYFLPGPWFRAIFWVQAVAYGIGLAGQLVPALGRFRIVGFLTTFLALKAATIVSLWRFLRSPAEVRWEKT